MNSINNNLMARNVANNLNSHYGRLGTSVERLSSGLRVNSASDDAAGLAIRELMRSDIASLNQGARNVNDAISMLQVADGALGIIDEKLIRMKELAEQAATGTYDSTQRLMINNEFQEMGKEIDRIARSTEFNGIHLLDGSLNGAHDGSGLESRGAMKIHFGTANDSAEDYYYVDIADCTMAGLGLATGVPKLPAVNGSSLASPGGQITFADGTSVAVNNWNGELYVGQHQNPYLGRMPWDTNPDPSSIQETMWTEEWCWSCGTWTGFGFIHVIPKGTKNVMFNIMGSGDTPMYVQTPTGETIPYELRTDTDIQLFTRDGKHLAGTPLTDTSYDIKNFWAQPQYQTGRPTEVSNIESYAPWLGFTEADYDGVNLNSGAANYETGYVDNNSLNWTTYNGMNIGYSGDGNTSNDGINQDGGFGYEVLVIDGEVTEDLIIWTPGGISSMMYQMYWDGGEGRPQAWDDMLNWVSQIGVGQESMAISIKTQDEAQKALTRIDDAIVTKDKIRAHIGALQNRFENTASNLNIQSENLQASESRISDADVAQEMMTFVRNQVLTQAAVAMLGQANSYPHMLAGLING